MSATIAIPARLESTRLPDKPLRLAGGKPLIQHTVEAVAGRDFNVVVVTDSDAVVSAVPSNVHVIHHMEPAWCGTQRIAHAAQKFLTNMWGSVIINLQADEPEIQFSDLLNLMLVTATSKSGIATLVAPLDNHLESDSSVVKAITVLGKCVDFRRTGAPPGSMHHVGVYGFKKDVLLKLGKLKQSKRSRDHSLEQLTWLDNSWSIDAVQIGKAPRSINTEADYEAWAESFRKAEIA